MKVSSYLNQYGLKSQNLFDHDVSGIYEKSSEVIENSVFVALKGYKKKGINYIDEAIKNGAKTIFYDDESYVQKDMFNINFFLVKSSKVELARLLKWFYKDAVKPIMIGITGTNGKTTVANLVYEFLKHHQKRVIYFGTSIIKRFIEQEYVETSSNTTPSITTLYHHLFENAYQYVVMEVSSQGIMEGRVLGMKFDIACYTNITQDHLDYHHTMDNYASAKARLALSLDDDSTLILNEDMAYYQMLKETSIAKLLTYSTNVFSNNATILGRLVKRDINEMTLAIWEGAACFEIKSKLLGDFNLENLLASYLILKSLGFTKKEVTTFYPTFSPVRGRMNVYQLKKKDENLYIVIDFAHTPEGLRQVIEYFLKIKTKRLVTIMGCGGNRDHEKRPIMGHIATKLSDYTYFTEDNSRDEEVENIIFDICKGAYSKNYEIIYQRKDAIDKAIQDAHHNDIILLLGKGSEEYIVRKTKVLFSDLSYIESLGGKKC